jgi:hypothetical protein
MDVELIARDGSNLLPGNASPASDAAPRADAKDWPGLPPAHARDGETRGRCWERLRKEGRAAGMPRQEAYAYATREADRLFPVVPPPPPEPEPPPADQPEPPPVVEAVPEVEPDQAPLPTEATPASQGSGLAGLGDIPIEWPTLPPNAQLQSEVSWVQANRLRVYQGGMVDLSRSLGPAPSHAALSWLETSLLYPAKWADVCVRAAQGTQDDTEQVRRERMALGEVRSMMDEAMASAVTA